MWVKSREGLKKTNSVDTVKGLVMIGCHTVEVPRAAGINKDERVTI